MDNGQDSSNGEPEYTWVERVWLWFRARPRLTMILLYAVPLAMMTAGFVLIVVLNFLNATSKV